jgi:hypothetical protein
VAAFYQKHPGLTSLGGVNETGGMFVKEAKGHTVYITVESPWQPSKGGELKKDLSSQQQIAWSFDPQG